MCKIQDNRSVFYHSHVLTPYRSNFTLRTFFCSFAIYYVFMANFNVFSSDLLKTLILPCTCMWYLQIHKRGCHGRDHMVIGFITTYA